MTSAIPLGRPFTRALLASTAVALLAATSATAAEGSRSAAALERRVSQLEEQADRIDDLEAQLGRLEDEVEALKSRLAADGADEEEAAQLEERIRALRDRLAGHDDLLKGVRRDLDRALGELPDVHFGAELDLAYVYDFNRPASGEVGLRALERQDEDDFSFHHAKLAATGSILNAVEARIDVLFGRSAQFLGPLTRGAIGSDDIDVEQASVSYRAPVGSGLTFSFGKVASRLGAEVIEPPANDPFSRSFLFTLGIPHTYTGIFAAYAFLDGLVDVELGAVNGWDSVDDGNDAKSLVARAAGRIGDRLDLSLAGIWGAEQADRNGPKRGVVDLIVTLRPTDEVSFLLDFLYGTEDQALSLAGDATIGDVSWTGFSGIARWDATENVSVSLRGEVFDDLDGARSGAGQQLWSVTETFAYEVVENLVARVEHRHDESDRQSFGRKQGLSRAQDTASFDVSYRF